MTAGTSALQQATNQGPGFDIVRTSEKTLKLALDELQTEFVDKFETINEEMAAMLRPEKK